jgi:hypothetical protein
LPPNPSTVTAFQEVGYNSRTQGALASQAMDLYRPLRSSSGGVDPKICSISTILMIATNCIKLQGRACAPLCQPDLLVRCGSRGMIARLARGEGNRSMSGKDQESVEEPARRRHPRVGIAAVRCCSLQPSPRRRPTRRHHRIRVM